MNKQEYIDYLRKFSEKFSVEDLKAVGIKSIKIIQEVMTKEPMMPLLVIERLDESEEKVWGMEEIAKKLNKIFENV